MHLRVKLQSSELAIVAGRLEPGFSRGSPSFTSMGISLGIHLGIVAGFWAMPISRVPARETRSAISSPTEIQIGGKLYYVARISPRQSPQTRAPRQEAPRHPAHTQRMRSDATPKPAVVAENHPPPRVFIPPPELKPDPAVKHILIQPISPPDLHPPDPMLPSFRLWSPQLLKIPKPFVAPGRPKLAVAAPPVFAPPTLELTYSEPAPLKQIAKITLPPVPAPTDPPQVIPPPDSPVRISAGDPLAVLSISDVPLAPIDKLVVPAGNLVPPPQDGTDIGVINAGAISGNGSAQSVLKPIGRSGSSRSSTEPPGAVLRGSGSTDSSGTPRENANQTAAKVILRPANGNYDTVVVQGSAIDLFPEAKGMLTGRPIYTVYISVDAAQEWALYYCLPGSGIEKPIASAIVQLTPVEPVQAPYPTRIVRPAVKFPSGLKYLLLHGFVTKGGRFQELRVVNDPQNKLKESVLAALGKWEFRPAKKDGVPTQVEFLLVIPSAGL